MYGTEKPSAELAGKGANLEIKASSYFDMFPATLGGLEIVKPVYCSIDHLGKIVGCSRNALTI